MVLIWSGSQGNVSSLPAARPRQTNFHVPSGPPAATQPPTLPKQPPAHREPPMPLSARQRKQIFMHSTVMDPAGPTPQSRYVFANQATFIDEVNRRICHSPRAPPEVVMPTPQDLRVTSNVGHSVITWDSSPAPAAGGKQEFVRWSEAGDAIQVVRARPGGEATGAQTKAMDASARKLHEQASEVLGAQRRMQKSTSTPAREIRPIAFAACNATDSNIDRAADNEPGGRRAAQAREARPLSARERHQLAMGASTSSQFAAYNKQARPPPSSRKARISSTRSEESAGDQEERRKGERNFSDIFGVPSPRAAGGEAPLSPRGADVYRPHVSSTGARAKREDPEGDRVLPLTPRAKAPDMSPQKKRVDDDTRICWDARGGMDMNLELARRHRERIFGCQDVESEQRTAFERKRAHLTSQGLRSGMGAPVCPHEEEVLSPRAAAACQTPRSCALLSPRSSVALSPRNSAMLSPRACAPLSPKSGTDGFAVLSPRARALKADSARGRKATGLMSSGIF